MALGVEFASVVVRTAVADDALPGGLDAFAPTRHDYIEDEHLFRTGFMSTREADELAAHLLSLGLDGDAVAVEQAHGPLPAWLRRGEIGGHRAVWLAGQDPGRLVRPLQSVILRGPSRLRDAVTAMRAEEGIEIVRVPPGEHEADHFEIEREGALVDLRVHHPDDDTIIFWAERRQERNRCCRADIELLEWLGAALKAAGAA
ncbi:hypothetical protein GCM10023085_73330 [Actinomadura viridis]|uniref:Uncharacterized protein n=1 Tax=Actinomadura viridis TaxID=58110 RepID=A0A931DKJ7_9ACTN|nr:hypothetical protein [Actinomadura viridis]MBG6092909.1 hypothetical protein [Actinomadura viridis]